MSVMEQNSAVEIGKKPTLHSDIVRNGVCHSHTPDITSNGPENEEKREWFEAVPVFKQYSSPALKAVEVVRPNHKPRVIIIPNTDQVKELHTILRDRTTCRNDYIFYADRLIRLVVEEGLNQLPCETFVVTTPTGRPYEGVRFSKGNCGVSVIRSGEAMERGLRDCCRSIRIGKILITTSESGCTSETCVDTSSSPPQVVYAKLPHRIAERSVLLMYPILHTGTKIIKAIELLLQYNVKDSNIVLLTLFATPASVDSIMQLYPGITLLTSEIHPDIPLNFGQRYFGTKEQTVEKEKDSSC